MNNFWKLSTGMLLGASLALTGCDLGSSDGNSSSTSSNEAALPATPLSYVGNNDPASINATNQGQLGSSATTSAGALLNNAQNGDVTSLYPTSVATNPVAKADDATLIGLFASFSTKDFSQLPTAVAGTIENPLPCAGAADPDYSIDAHAQLGTAYVVVTFTNTCMEVLPGDATINGKLVVEVENGTPLSFTPSSLTVTDTAGTIYNVPAGTYTLDNGKLSVSVSCGSNRTCKITAPTTGPTKAGDGSYSFTGATVFDPVYGSFTVNGSGLLLCTGTTTYPFSSGTLTLTGDAGTLVLSFSDCVTPPTPTFTP